jgi:hypothetical protein
MAMADTVEVVPDGSVAGAVKVMDGRVIAV